MKQINKTGKGYTILEYSIVINYENELPHIENINGYLNGYLTHIYLRYVYYTADISKNILSVELWKHNNIKTFYSVVDSKLVFQGNSELIYKFDQTDKSKLWK